VKRFSFRGFLFEGFRKHWGFLLAALLSGLLFAGAHGQPGLVIPFGMIGFIFAFVYQKSRSLPTSISAHFLFNLINFSLLVSQARL
jgi:membrane protease YdiL (CAAX protease family)